ncbi:MarR family winged helix-turn-helix transcriptional regulator [Frankia sp. AvcI1]|uniref:MarR family winged helix-turn-helix transcriptional regulator n=1 Tax=Frankia sp. AvcI1 TaxID=573496 RepID=UPI00211734CE|nr:MarR family winged helix-turn-helix transcriptional regulator [Frankia sp. AvcI1]
MDAAPATPSGHDEAGDSPLARLEVALSALVRWSESRHIRLQVTRRSGCELSASELRLLEHFDAAGPMRVSDIASCLHIDISTVSLQLRALRRDHLVERLADAQDRRVAVIIITAKGREVVRRVRLARRDLLGEVFAQTGTVDLDQAARVLLQVQTHMRQGVIDGPGGGSSPA